MPSPPRTRGTLSDLVYTRRPGLDIRLRPEIVRLRSGVYFRRIESVFPGRSSELTTS